jgi:hypothetical protein
MSSIPFPAENMPADGKPAPWLDLVERQVSALKFGSVQITVENGRVAQVETSVRVRFDNAR